MGEILRSWGRDGLFGRIAALLVGRARDYSEREKRELDRMIVLVVRDEFGHADRTMGAQAEVDADRGSFHLVERPTVT